MYCYKSGEQYSEFLIIFSTYNKKVPKNELLKKFIIIDHEHLILHS